MPYDDLREFLAVLESKGLLARVKAEVDPEWEINGIAKKLADEEGPAVLFENVKGHSVPVLCNLLRTLERLALALEMPVDEKEIRDESVRRLENPIAPKLLENGSCKENILLGDKAELDVIFPPVKWHREDGGRYIGTYGLQVTKDPETGIQNTGLYRQMVRTKKETGLLMEPYQHGGQHLEKWGRLYPGKPMPMAVAIGTEPCYLLAACEKFEHPPAEDDYAGGLRKKPVELVKCETCDLAVPATSEIVLEGEVYPDERKLDGPFGEYTGHEGEAQMLNVFHLKCITHRDHPIFLGTRQGYPSESPFTFIRGFGNFAHMKLRRFLGVEDTHIPLGSCGMKLIVSLRKRYPGHANEIIQSIFGDPGLRFIKCVVVVDDGINIRDPTHVEWATSNYVQADRDVLIVPRCAMGILDVSQPYSKRGWTAKWGVDATTPIHEYQAEGAEPPRLCDDPDIKAKVEAQWNKYSIKVPKGSSKPRGW